MKIKTLKQLQFLEYILIFTCWQKAYDYPNELQRIL